MEVIFNREYLKKCLRIKGLTYLQLTELLKEVGMPTAEVTVKSWFRKKEPATPDMNRINAIAKVLDIQVDDIAKIKKSSPVFQLGAKTIPIVGEASCGLPITNAYQGDDFMYVSDDIYDPELYGVIASGDSMLPEISDGDSVICNPKEAVLNGDLVHYTLFGESAIKVYFYNEKTKILTLKPINTAPYFQTINITEDDKESLENIKYVKVVQIIKSTKNNRKERLKMIGLD